MERRQKSPLGMVARMIGFVAAGFFLSFIIGELRKQGGQVIAVEAGLAGMSGGIALAGCIVSWWWERLAGILLISASAVWGIVSYTIMGTPSLTVWAIYGLPYLVAGMLFFNSWRLSRD